MLGLKLGNTEKMAISSFLPSSCTRENLFHKEIPFVRKTRQKCFDMCKFLLLTKIISLSLLTLLTGLLVFNKYQCFKLHAQENCKSVSMVIDSYHLLCTNFSSISFLTILVFYTLLNLTFEIKLVCPYLPADKLSNLDKPGASYVTRPYVTLLSHTSASFPARHQTPASRKTS